MSPRLVLFVAPVLLSLAQPVLAQCSLQVSGSPQPELSGTALALTLVSPPQLGTTFRLAVQNLSGGPAVMLLGLSYQNLLLQPYGFGLACRLLATPDATQFLVTSGGTGSWSLAIPNAPAFAGLHLWNQVLEFSAIHAVSNGGDGEIR